MSELTIEQMRQIVDGAPDWAKGYNTAIQKYTRSVWFSKDILLSDLKAQIDQHYYGQSEEKELEQYAILSQEKIEGGAVLVSGSSIQKMVDYQDVIANQKAEIDQLKVKNTALVHALVNTNAEKTKWAHSYWAQVERTAEYGAMLISNPDSLEFSCFKKEKEIEKLKAEKAGFKNLVKSLRSEFDLNGGSDQVERQIELLEEALRGGDQNTKNCIQAIESNGNRGGDQNGEH